jgi:arylsulfatase A-like enzyme
MSNPENPNIVIVVMDTARAKTILRSGKPRFPNLRKLADEGTCFTRAFADAPWTLPSHASLFTGTKSSQHGANAAHKYLNEDLHTISEVLSSVGYETAMVTNNAWLTDDFGMSRGFNDQYKAWQYFQTEVDIGPIVMNDTGPQLLKNVASQVRRGNPVKNIVNMLFGRFKYRSSDYGAARTNKLVKKYLSNRQNPFFLFVNYLEPHLKYQPPKEYASEYLDCEYEEALNIPQEPWRYTCGTLELSDQELDVLEDLYTAEIAYLDQRLGEIVEYLKKTNRWQNTLFFVLGDHGENIGEHEMMDHQYCLYDTLLHVPLIVTGGPFNGPSSDNQLVQISDIFPTIFDILNLTDNEVESQFKGSSFLSNSSKRDQIVSEYVAPQPSIEALKEKVGDAPINPETFNRSLRAVRTDDWKFIRGSDGTRELYNIEDPNDEEDTNLYESKPECAASLGKALDDWLESFQQAGVARDDDIEINEGTKRRLEDLGYI